VSRSSTEAEYRSIAAVLADIIWLLALLNELHIHLSLPQIFSDNLGAILLSANPIMHSGTKHFQLDMHFVRDYVQKKKVSLVHLPTRYQVADVLTKPLSKSTFTHFKDKLMVVINPTISLRRDVKYVCKPI